MEEKDVLLIQESIESCKVICDEDTVVCITEERIVIHEDETD
jgi:hypothetical protein